MHTTSYRIMQELVCDERPHVVVDFGSQDVNGTYAPLFPSEVQYVGVDLTPGKNVTMVMPTEFSTDLPTGCANLVISGQCLEHCRNPFRLVEEMYRVCTAGGKCCIIAPFVWKEHRYPIDCFRFLPDGMRAVMEFAGFKNIETALGHNGVDCWGKGVK